MNRMSAVCAVTTSGPRQALYLSLISDYPLTFLLRISLASEMFLTP